MIDLRRLRVLRAIAYHGTVTAAARSLHLTPSAASQQVRQLGRELGVRLLEPRGRQVRLTEQARVLLRHAEAIEQRWQQAQGELRAADPAAPAGLLRISGITTVIAELLAPAAALLGSRWPALTVSIRESEPPSGFDLLFAMETDLLVTMSTPDSPPWTDERFDQRPLLDDPLELLTAPDHPLAGRAGVRLADLAEEPWILSMPGTGYRQSILALCNAAGFTPAIAHEVLEWAAVANLVGHGLGISLVPALAALPGAPPVVRTPLAGAQPYRRLLTAIRRGNRTDPAIAAALDVLHELLPAAGGR